MKRKPHRVYDNCGAVTSLAWVHTGDYLYAGTRTGDVMCAYLDKASCSSVWNSSSVERRANEDEEEEAEDSIVIIRKVDWLPSQHPNTTSIGCLFVLLGAFGDSSAECLQSVLVGLTPDMSTSSTSAGSSSAGQGDNLNEIMCIPPLHMEDIVGFRVVPSVDKKLTGALGSVGGAGKQPAENPSIVPAVLMVTQKINDAGKVLRQLKILRCSTSVDMVDWALEIGLLSEPRVAAEVLPGGSAEVSSIAAMLPPVPGSFTEVLLSTASPGVLMTHNALDALRRSSFSSVDSFSGSDAESTGGTPSRGSSSGTNNAVSQSAHSSSSEDIATRRLSARDFFGATMHGGTTSDTWELVLASAAHKDAKLTSKPLDVVLLGHTDGSIIAWGVSRPNTGTVVGKGTIWVPLRSLNVGTCNVTCIETDSTRLLAAGDESGNVVVWETCEESTGRGALDGVGTADLQKYPTFDSSTSDSMVTAIMAHENLQASASGGGHGRPFAPDGLRVAFKGEVRGKVTSIAIVGEALTMFVGTENGTLFCARDWGSGELVAMQFPPNFKLGVSGAVVHMLYSSFWFNGQAVPALYTFYSSGHVLVWHVFTNELIAYCVGPSEMYVDVDEEFSVLYGHVLDGHLKPLARPDPFAKPKRHVTTADDKGSVISPPPAGGSGTQVTPPRPISPPSGGEGSKLTSLLRRTGSSTSNILTPEAATGRPAAAAGPPAEEGRSLVVIGCHAVITYDLAKFSTSLKYSSQSGSQPFSPVVPNAASSKFLSEERIVAAECTIFVEDAARAYTDPIPCISCISSDGELTVIALRTRQVMTEHVEISLLKGVERKPVDLSDGVLLPNGDCYLLGNDCMVYCASYTSTNYCHNHASPVRATCQHLPPPREWQFRTGREERIQAAKKAVAKRRTSMITLTAAPTDLDKLFAKTRTDWTREELFGIANEEEEERARNAHRAATQAAHKSTSAVKSEMNELGKALEERGERLRQINERMEVFRDAAAEYKKGAAEQKQRLAAKAARWGVF